MLSKIRSSFCVLFLLIFLLSLQSLTFAQSQCLEKQKAFGPIGTYASQYSPYMLSYPGWAGILMYYCKNTEVGGLYRDRVWRTENWGWGWINDMIVIEGTIGKPDDLSCSPGVVITSSGNWHMYYITADRRYPASHYLYHAVASAPGTSWSKRGSIFRDINNTPQPVPYYVETPSPFYVNGKFVVYLAGELGKLYRMESTDGDGHNFGNPTLIFQNTQRSSQSGHVSFINGKWYYVYALNPTAPYAPPTEIWIASSTNGINFTNEHKLFGTTPGDWDATYIFSPHVVYDYKDQKTKVFYAGNNGNYDWWGSNTSIGFCVISLP